MPSPTSPPPKWDILKISSLVPVNINLFGNRVFEDVTKLKWGHAGFQSNFPKFNDWCPYKYILRHIDTHKEEDHEIKDTEIKVIIATNQEMLRRVTSFWKVSFLFLLLPLFFKVTFLQFWTQRAQIRSVHGIVKSRKLSCSTPPL